MPRLRVALAQLNLVVGDLEGNAARIIETYERAEADACDLVAFHELAITGYPPEDLLLRPAFVAQAQESLEKVAARTGRAVAVLGFPLLERDLYNAAAVCANGKVQGVYRKHILPNSTVFDEQRYFTASSTDGPLFNVAGTRVAVTVCEDAWSPSGPIITQAAGGAELVVNINGSPYYAGRLRERETMLSTRAADASVPIVYVNLVGGQDELVFDGGSLVFDEQGRLVARARQFTEDLLVVDLDVRPTFRKRLLDPRGRWSAPALADVKVTDAHIGERGERPRIEPSLPPVREVYEALALGTRDYVVKNGFTDVIIGLSGDMAGGFSVIKDVPKMLVYALARDRNERAGRDLVPESVLDKPPSAELRPDQRDSDALPDYALLDPILEGYVEGDLSVAELEEAGFDPDTVRRVARLVDRNEYKRRQAPPGVRVSPKPSV